MSEKLYVSNVHSSITGDELRFAFSFYCEVVDAFLEKDENQQSSSGYVVIKDKTQTRQVMLNMQKMEIDGRRIKVSLTEELQPPPPSKKVKLLLPENPVELRPAEVVKEHCTSLGNTHNTI